MWEKVLGIHTNHGHHNHHHHHGHHNHHHGHHHHGHKDKEVIIVVDKTQSAQQNQGFKQGYNAGLSQGFNAGLNQSIQQNYNHNVNQGYNHHPTNQTSPIQITLFNPNVDYIITSCNNDDYALDVSQDNLSKGSLLIWKKDKSKRNQRFRIIQQNGWYNIFSISDMNVISSVSNSNEIGDRLSSYQNVGAQGQCWRFDYCSDKKDKNQFFIRNGFDRYLDVCEGKMKNGTAVIQYQYNGNKNQKWKITPA